MPLSAVGFPEFAPAQAYTLELPRVPRPIVILGAGGIVRDAHLPAYRKAGFVVSAICDVNQDRARALAERDFMGVLREVLPKAALKTFGAEK